MYYLDVISRVGCSLSRRGKVVFKQQISCQGAESFGFSLFCKDDAGGWWLSELFTLPSCVFLYSLEQFYDFNRRGGGRKNSISRNFMPTLFPTE